MPVGSGDRLREPVLAQRPVGKTSQRIVKGEVRDMRLGLLALGNVLDGTYTAHGFAFRVKLQFDKLIDPANLVANDNAMINVVGCAFQRRLP